MFSQVILIDRGLKILLSNIKREGKTKKILSSFQGTTQKKRESGGNNVVDTPVPIPNTEVKHHSGFGIGNERTASCRALFFYGGINKKRFSASIYQYLLKMILFYDCFL